MVNFSLLTAEICWRIWGIPANFNGFCVLAALLHGTLVVGVLSKPRFVPRGAMLARYVRCSCVRLSVRHKSLSIKTAKPIITQKSRTPGTLSFSKPKVLVKLRRVTPTGTPNVCAVGKFVTFNKYLASYQTIQDNRTYFLRKANRKSYELS